MKNANAWVICGVLVSSLILGLVAPLDESAEPASHRSNGTDLAAMPSCAPFTVKSVKYAEVDLRLGADKPQASFGF